MTESELTELIEDFICDEGEKGGGMAYVQSPNEPEFRVIHIDGTFSPRQLAQRIIERWKV